MYDFLSFLCNIGVLRGPDGVFENAPSSSLLIDCSTIDPGTSTVLNEEAAAAGHRMIDAPVNVTS